MKDPEVSTLIAREIGSETNRRFLTRLPGLRANETLPSQFRSLLERLEEAEHGPRTTRH